MPRVGPPLAARRIIGIFDGLTMTDLLEKALSEVKKLSPSEQDALGAILLQELAAEQRQL